MLLSAPESTTIGVRSGIFGPGVHFVPRTLVTRGARKKKVARKFQIWFDFILSGLGVKLRNYKEKWSRKMAARLHLSATRSGRELVGTVQRIAQHEESAPAHRFKTLGHGIRHGKRSRTTTRTLTSFRHDWRMPWSYK